ncbi:MAG: PIG-L deacetylase family protein [Myxococcota bacterium]
MLPERLEDWTGQTVVCFGAHPDDDLHAAGSFARLVSAGNAVHLVMYTDDDKGSLDPAMTSERLRCIRRSEQETAARVLGIPIQNLHWLGHGDGELEYVDARRLCREATALIRELRPAAVFSFDPGAVHVQLHKSDHRSAALSTLDAVRAARWPLYFPELIEQGLEPHEVSVCYFYDSREPDCVVDIEPTLRQKIEAFCSHVSQFGRRLRRYEPELHPEDRSAFERAIREHCARVGAPHGLRYAEAFRRVRDP